MDMTPKEIDLLDEKLENPQKKLYCPRCNGKIIIEECGPGCIVKCENNCIHETIRGI